MTDAEKIVVLDGARTPVGSFGGVFRDVPGVELGALASKAALSRSGIEATDIDEVVMGCIGQVGADAYNAHLNNRPVPLLADYWYLWSGH
jgi:acetyl-CoA C-acetyltransferase